MVNNYDWTHQDWYATASFFHLLSFKLCLLVLFTLKYKPQTAEYITSILILNEILLKYISIPSETLAIFNELEVIWGFYCQRCICADDIFVVIVAYKRTSGKWSLLVWSDLQCLTVRGRQLYFRGLGGEGSSGLEISSGRGFFSLTLAALTKVCYIMRAWNW